MSDLTQRLRRLAARTVTISVAIIASLTTARAQLAAPDPYPELGSKYLFGFTKGADIGLEGEKAIEFETTASFQKRHGTYRMIEQEFEFEGVPSQFFAYELSLHTTSHSIKGVDGLDNLNRTQFSGLSTDLRYLLIGRGPGSPIGLTISAQPEWARVDGTSGVRTRGYGTTFRLAADTELVANRMYAAVNLIYQPEVGKEAGAIAWNRSSTAGATAALAYRVAPKVTLGGEVEYYRAYDGLAFRTFAGHALYVGPTMNVQFTSKTMLSLAYSTQVSGRAAGESHSLDLTNFQRHHANAKLEFEF
ncbi:Putative MetA-pathway of phenol degradation [Rhizobiales bacterium GAS191]|nr:Putative MetA-pathway of phenol degradation [Rhizobiales bacterium GAS191]